MREKLKRFRTQLPYLAHAWRLIWAAARQWTVAWIALLVVQGVLPILTVYLTATLVDRLTGPVQAQGDWLTVRPILGWVTLLVGVLLISDTLGSVTTWVRTVQAERVQDHIAGLIHAKALALDLAFYDQPDYYDRLERAQSDAAYRPVALLENVGVLLQNLLTFVAMASVLVQFGWWLPLVLCLAMTPALLVVVRSTLREYGWQRQTTSERRRTHYYNWIITEREAAAEIRLFALGHHFRQHYQTLRHRLQQEHQQLTRAQMLAEIAAGALALALSGGVLAWMIWRTVQGQVTLGNLALFYQAFNQGQRLMHTLLNSVGQIYSNILFLENLFEFLALQPQLADPAIKVTLPPRLQTGIHLRQVTFCYPGSIRIALQNFNLSIPAGQIVALVGENGAGKSTLIKLLCRFYDPDDGVITFDGIDLRQVAQDELRRRITVLFQQPVHYHATAAENIQLGDLGAERSTAAIHHAAQAAGADVPINRLPAGYETMLGKWFGGAELSGGEWQRVALARAFLRQADLIILDEPTSAMDSWAEVDWMGRFRQLVAGRTALIITHRFTTAMQADIIHVMADGHIVESGNHAQLMSCQGRYAQSWQQQIATVHPPESSPSSTGKEIIHGTDTTLRFTLSCTAPQYHTGNGSPADASNAGRLATTD